jgi:hypothetical protein
MSLPTYTRAPVVVRLNEDSITFLQAEAERMERLYSAALEAGQNVFNFYVTFISGLVGGLIFLLQGREALTNTNFALALMGLLLFSGIVGVVFLSAISGRYAHASRYANTLDTIRYYLLQHTLIKMPPLYDNFSSDSVNPKRGNPLRRLLPTGTYQMFIGVMTSAMFALVVWMVGLLGAVNVYRGLQAAVAVFFLCMFLSNIYAHAMTENTIKNLHVRVDSGVVGGVSNVKG